VVLLHSLYQVTSYCIGMCADCVLVLQGNGVCSCTQHHARSRGIRPCSDHRNTKLHQTNSYNLIDPPKGTSRICLTATQANNNRNPSQNVGCSCPLPVLPRWLAAGNCICNYFWQASRSSLHVCVLKPSCSIFVSAPPVHHSRSARKLSFVELRNFARAVSLRLLLAGLQSAKEGFAAAFSYISSFELL
jgi:hypothetical protein